MKTSSDAVTHAIQEYRGLTGAEAASAATRARVLTAFERRRRWQARGQRLWTALTLTAVLIGSATLAVARIARWVQPPAVVLPSTDDEPAPLGAEHHRARVTVPVVTAPAGVPEQAPDGEARLYAAAHAAHFAEQNPQAALAAWNGYLRAYPHGAFAPEARFNRGICLIRLRRFPEAVAALVPFASGRFGSYRRAEANRLLEWLSQPALSGAPAR